MSLREVIARHRVVVCVGSGGVGKTTAAAAIGLWGARQDFLEAPRRLDDFLDRRIIRWFVRPYLSATWSGMRVLNRTVNFVLRRLEEATGVSALLSISEFFTAMGGLFDGFHARVERAYEILLGAETAFVLVTCPDEQVLGEAGYLSGKMAALGMPLKGVIFNRTHTDSALDGSALDGQTAEGGRELLGRIVERALGDPGVSPSDVRALVENCLRYRRLGHGEARRMAAFARALGSVVPTVRVPNFPHDLHDVAGLLETHPHLFGEGGDGARG
jgi:anion-transporting  ArsA/GET3 family ATPase